MNLTHAIRNTQNTTQTENGMTALKETMSGVMNFFYQVGGFRGVNSDRKVNSFLQAYGESPELALRVLMWSRDIRGGAGERQTFRQILKYLAMNRNQYLIQNLSLISEVGRWDDLWELFGTPIENKLIEFIVGELSKEKPNGLLCKWIPRKGIIFGKFRKAMKMNSGEFRRLLTKNTQVVETSMCTKNWSSINFSHVPSQASKKYVKAFHRNDGIRYVEYIEAAKAGKVKINAKAIFPHEVLRMTDTELSHGTCEAMWKQLPNYMDGCQERVLPVCDVSGSMDGLPMEVCVALGLYISERNEGLFKNAFITFNTDPKLQYLGENLNIVERKRLLERSGWGYNTDLQKTFKLILDAAVKNNLPSSEMPTQVLIMSDMQFDEAIKGASNPRALDMINRMYADAGYRMPKIVFWNLRTSEGYPCAKDEEGVAMISGYSPAILKAILSGKELSIFTPYNIMLDVINIDKYKLNGF